MRSRRRALCARQRTPDPSPTPTTGSEARSAIDRRGHAAYAGAFACHCDGVRDTLKESLAGAVGLGSTWFALTRGAAFGTLQIGAWTARPKTGTADIDPYARAAIARIGALPVGLGAAVPFRARTADTAHPRAGRCDTLISGTPPPARYFTLTLYEPDGKLAANSLDRQGFTSHELIRNHDGSSEITVAPRTRAR